MRSLFKGYWPTFWRDVPTFGLFFFVYENLKNLMIKDTDSNGILHAKLVLASGFAGIINWIPTYPFDLIKSIIQCDTHHEARTMREVVQDMLAKERNIRCLFRGLLPTLIMAGPLHVFIILAYEKLSEIN